MVLATADRRLDPRPLAGWPPDLLMQALQREGMRPAQARGAVRTVMRACIAQVPSADPVSLQAARLLEMLTLPEPQLELVSRATAADHTCRLLWRTGDGEIVESVIIPSRSGQGGGRTTLCLSSQVGCGRRCAFCETGRLGLVRNLTAAEIVLQYRGASALWQVERGANPEIRNVVFMGMGEPLDNLDAVCDAIEVFCHDFGAGLAARRITVSTVGVVPHLVAFLQRSRAHLALSLNAPDDARRLAIMPVHRDCGLDELKRALLEHLGPGRDVLIEYILFDGVNDAPEDADLLRAWLDGVPARLNLIPANPGPDPRLTAPDAGTVRAFQKRLLDVGVRAMVRHPHGREVGGACGQLAGRWQREQEQLHVPT